MKYTRLVGGAHPNKLVKLSVKELKELMKSKGKPLTDKNNKYKAWTKAQMIDLLSQGTLARKAMREAAAKPKSKSTMTPKQIADMKKLEERHLKNEDIDYFVEDPEEAARIDAEDAPIEARLARLAAKSKIYEDEEDEEDPEDIANQKAKYEAHMKTKASKSKVINIKEEEDEEDEIDNIIIIKKQLKKLLEESTPKLIKSIISNFNNLIKQIEEKEQKIEKVIEKVIETITPTTSKELDDLPELLSPKQMKQYEKQMKGERSRKKGLEYKRIPRPNKDINVIRQNFLKHINRQKKQSRKDIEPNLTDLFGSGRRKKR